MLVARRPIIVTGLFIILERLFSGKGFEEELVACQPLECSDEPPTAAESEEPIRV